MYITYGISYILCNDYSSELFYYLPPATKLNSLALFPKLKLNDLPPFRSDDLCVVSKCIYKCFRLAV